MNYERSANVSLYFLLGGIAGAAAALLLAPRSGREMRQLIGERAREGQQLANRAVERGKQAAQQAAGYVRRKRGSTAPEYNAAMDRDNGGEQRQGAL